MSKRIEGLKAAVEMTHHCIARHAGYEMVIEDELAWDGIVDIFDLEGHPKAKRCYAWSFMENGETQYTAVLELPPVDSAESAVKTALAARGRLL